MINDVNDLDPITVANRLRPMLLHLNRRLRQELAPLGITGGQASLLWAIRSNPGVGVRELADREGVSPPAMTAHADIASSMFGGTRTAGRRCWIDLRRVELALTDEGLRVLAASARGRRTASFGGPLKRSSRRARGARGGASGASGKLLHDHA